MAARPVSAGDPEDPAAIRGLLPERWHEQFLAEHREALEAAREVRPGPFLGELLHRWRGARGERFGDQGLLAFRLDEEAQLAADGVLIA